MGEVDKSISTILHPQEFEVGDIVKAIVSREEYKLKEGETYTVEAISTSATGNGLGLGVVGIPYTMLSNWFTKVTEDREIKHG